MTNREYFVDVTIMNTKDAEFDKWEHVGSFINVLDDNFTVADTGEIAFQIHKAIREYEKGQDD